MRESPMLVTVLSTVYGKLGNRKEVVPVMTTLSPSPLTASDRCDRCGAQAYAARAARAGTRGLRMTDRIENEFQNHVKRTPT